MGNIEKAVKIASTCLKIKITDFYFKCDSSKNDETFYNMVVAANNYMLNVQRFVPSIWNIEKAVKIASSCIKIKITDSSLSVTAPKITKHSTYGRGCQQLHAQSTKICTKSRKKT